MKSSKAFSFFEIIITLSVISTILLILIPIAQNLVLCTHKSTTSNTFLKSLNEIESFIKNEPYTNLLKATYQKKTFSLSNNKYASLQPSTLKLHHGFCINVELGTLNPNNSLTPYHSLTYAKTK